MRQANTRSTKSCVACHYVPGPYGMSLHVPGPYGVGIATGLNVMDARSSMTAAAIALPRKLKPSVLALPSHMSEEQEGTSTVRNP